MLRIDMRILRGKMLLPGEESLMSNKVRLWRMFFLEEMLLNGIRLHVGRILLHGSKQVLCRLLRISSMLLNGKMQCLGSAPSCNVRK